MKNSDNSNNYMGTSEAAKIWEEDRDTISRWCRENRIPGAEQDRPGTPWRIPKDSTPIHKKFKKKELTKSKTDQE